MTPGIKTSEFKFATAVFILGLTMEIVGGALATLNDTLPGVAWVGVALAVVGALKQVAALLGYTKARAQVKSEALWNAKAEGQDAAAQIKDLKDAVEVLKARVGPQP